MTFVSDTDSPVFDGATSLDRLEGQALSSGAQTAAAIVATTGLELIPVIGGSLSALVGGTIDAVTARKRDLLVDEMARRLDILCEVAVEWDIASAAADPRFVAAARAAYQQVLSEHEEQKILWLAAAAANSGSWSPLSDMRQRYFMDLALSWRQEQMVLFTLMRDDFFIWLDERGLADPDPSRQEARFDAFRQSLYGDGDWENLRFAEDYVALMNLNFVKDMPAIGIPPGTAGWHTSLTPLGNQFWAFVREAAVPSGDASPS